MSLRRTVGPLLITALGGPAGSDSEMPQAQQIEVLRELEMVDRAIAKIAVAMPASREMKLDTLLVEGDLEVPAGYILVGSSADGKSNVFITEGSLKLRNGTTDKITLAATGDASLTGALSIGTAGNMSSGQTAYDTGTGFWLEYNGGTPRLSIGAAAGSKLTWNGTTLSITGTVTITAGSLSINYVAGQTGANIDTSGNAEFNNVTLRGALNTAVMVYNQIHSAGGSLILSKSAMKLRTGFTTVDSPTTFNVDVSDAEGSTHAASQLAIAADILRIKDGASDAWMTVSSVSDQTTFWRYVCTKSSPAAGTNYTFYAGAGIVNYGQTGQGFLYLTADDANGPFYSVRTHAGSPWSATTEMLRTGNLNGNWGYVAATYGIAMGQYGAAQANVTLDATNGLRMRNNTTTLINIQNDGDILIGTDVSAPATTNLAIFTTAQTYNSEAVGVGDLLLGDNTASKANLYWDLSAGTLAFRSGTTTKLYIGTDGKLKIGNDTSAISFLNASGTEGGSINLDGVNNLRISNITPAQELDLAIRTAASDDVAIKWGANSGVAEKPALIVEVGTQGLYFAIQDGSALADTIIQTAGSAGGTTFANFPGAVNVGTGTSTTAGDLTVSGNMTATTVGTSGTWTPAFAGTTIAGAFTYTIQQGAYTRIGNLVYITGDVGISAIGTPPTGGGMLITGLPFTSEATYDGTLSFSQIDNFNYTAAAMQLMGKIAKNSGNIFLTESFDNAAFGFTPAANFTNINCNLIFSGFYRV